MLRVLLYLFDGHHAQTFLSQLTLHVGIVTHIALGSHQNDWNTRAVVGDLGPPVQQRTIHRENQY